MFSICNIDFLYCSYKVECALFGNYVDDLNCFLASGDNQYPVIIIQFAKVKTFQGFNPSLWFLNMFSHLQKAICIQSDIYTYLFMDIMQVRFHCRMQRFVPE